MGPIKLRIHWITCRYLVAISSLPLLVFLLFSRFLPESLMFLAVTGQKDLVERQLNTVAPRIV